MPREPLKVGDIVAPIQPTKRQLKEFNEFFKKRANMIGLIIEAPSIHFDGTIGCNGITVKWLGSAQPPTKFLLETVLRKVC